MTILLSLLILSLPIIIVGFIFLSAFYAKKKKANILISNYEKLDNELLNENFDIKCEYCFGEFNTKNKNCPFCGGTYEKNQVYLSKKKDNELKYLDYLKRFSKNIDNDIENIKKQAKYLKTNIVMKNSYYNFDLTKPLPKYTKKDSFLFECEYCGTKLNGKSNDDKSCCNCGAKYNDNRTLLILEETDNIELKEYKRAVIIREKMEELNLKNYKKDMFINKHGGLITILILLFIITVFCLCGFGIYKTLPFMESMITILENTLFI